MQTRRRLNNAFKDFCKKVEKVAKHYDHVVDFDIPYNELGFYGNCNKEMVFIQPSVKALVNLTETPFFFLPLDELEHIHFERVTYTTKQFDIAFIWKNFDLPPKAITAIDMKYLDLIQDWLNDVGLTYTMGAANMAWNDVMKMVKTFVADGSFYSDMDIDGESKPPGWMFLNTDGGEGGGEEEEDDDDDESDFQADSEESESEEESSDDDESDYESESDDSEEDGDDDLSEEGKDWEELEQDAARDDKKRQHEREREDDDRGSSKKKRH
jgi:nucleosome binding factor SPN SPT16 subunit